MNDISFDPQGNSYRVDMASHSPPAPPVETEGYLQETLTELNWSHNHFPLVETEGYLQETLAELI